MIDAYLRHKQERNAQGIPPLPLNPEQTEELCKLLESPPQGQEDFLLELLKERVSPGVDPAAEVKAAFLDDILKGKTSSPLISKQEAVKILGTMIGGYNVQPLIDALDDEALADEAACALAGLTYVYDAAEQIIKLAKSNPSAKKVAESWAEAE